MTIDHAKRQGRFCASIGPGEAVCALPIGHESNHYCCGLHPSWPYYDRNTNDLGRNQTHAVAAWVEMT